MLNDGLFIFLLLDWLFRSVSSLPVRNELKKGQSALNVLICECNVKLQMIRIIAAVKVYLLNSSLVGSISVNSSLSFANFNAKICFNMISLNLRTRGMSTFDFT